MNQPPPEEGRAEASAEDASGNPAPLSGNPAPPSVIPAPPSVIPAKAGTQERGAPPATPLHDPAPAAAEAAQHTDDTDDTDDDDDDEDEDDEAGPPSRSPAAPRRDQGGERTPPPAIRFEDVVSGQFDAEEDNPDAAPLKRVLSPQPETPKLHKVLAQAGLGSRLEMEQLITEGRISVNNEPAHIGQRIQFGDQVKINGKPVRVRIDPPPARVLAYHKPVGEVVTHDDPQNRPTVFRRLPRLQQGKWQSVGRLDLNTEGLLLFTSSGELANKLMHPRFGLEREYAVRVLGALSAEEKQRLLDGVDLEDGRAQFGSIEDGGGEGANAWYRVTISEGRNREVRRLFEAVGRAVSRLIRIRYGAMVLPRGLRRGSFMELDEGDIRALIRAAGATPERAPRIDDDAAGRGGGRRRGAGPRPNASRPQGPGPQGGKPGGGQRRKGGGAGGGGGGSSQPDPLKTSLGYIGADSFNRQRRDGPPGQGRGGPPGQRRGGPGKGRGGR